MHFHSGNKDKIGLVVREIATRWISCTHINEGLRLAYAKASETTIFPLYSRNSLEVVSQIIKSDITHLVFLDHQVRPLEILRNPQLLETIKSRKIQILLHVYGCYVDRLIEYREIFTLLENENVHFVASSPKHKKLVEFTLNTPQDVVHLIPFPLKESKASTHQTVAELRNNLNLPEHGKMFLYTGRISTFKNVEIVMKLFAKAREKNPDIFFVYVGNFDSLDSFTINDKVSNQAIANAKLLQTIDPKSTWCFHRAFVNEEELRDYYLAADAFISLSVCRGEDFGMSVLEASSYGLPCFLTDWGGYSGFAHLPQTYLAPVELAEDDILISTDGLEEKIQTFIPSSEEMKLEKMRQVTSDFGQDTTSLRIHKMLASNRTQVVEFKKALVVQRHFLRRAKSWALFSGLKDIYVTYAS